MFGDRNPADESILDELRAWGADESTINRWRKHLETREKDSDLLVLPELWPACELYLRCQTQWVYAGMAGVMIGLNYPGVDVVMQHGGYDADAFAGLQVIESEILRLTYERRNNG